MNTLVGNNESVSSPMGSPSAVTTSRPPAAADAPTPSRTQAGTMTLEALLKSRIKDCSPVGTSPLNSLNQEKSQHYALIYKNQQSFTSYLQAKYGSTTFNNPHDFDTHVSDFLAETVQGMTLDEGYNPFQKTDEEVSNAIKNEKYKNVAEPLPVKQQGIHNEKNACCMNAPLMCVRDMFLGLSEEEQKKILKKLIDTHQTVALFLQGKYDATTKEEANELRLDLKNIIKEYKTRNSIPDENPDEESINALHIATHNIMNAIKDDGSVITQSNLGSVALLATAIGVDQDILFVKTLINNNKDMQDILKNVNDELSNEASSSLDLSSSNLTQFSVRLDARNVNDKHEINNITDTIESFRPTNIVCFLGDTNKGHFINIFSRKDSGNKLKWYATNDQKTEEIDLKQAMTEDDKQKNLSISFGAENLSSSSGSTAVDTTTWKQFIALRAVNVTYVKDTVA